MKPSHLSRFNLTHWVSLAPTQRVLTLMVACLMSMTPLMAEASSGHEPAADAHGGDHGAASPKKKRVLSEAEKTFKAFRKELALMGEVKLCMRDPKCISTESDLLKRAENARKEQMKLEDMAKAGNLEASYWRGKTSAELAEDLALQARDMEDPQLQKSLAYLVKRAREERKVAERYFGPAAASGMPNACYQMGLLYFAETLNLNDRPLAHRLFYCAAKGYIAEGKSKQAFEAYAYMLRSGEPQNPATVEVYAKLMNKEPETNLRKIQELRAVVEAQEQAKAEKKEKARLAKLKAQEAEHAANAVKPPKTSHAVPAKEKPQPKKANTDDLVAHSI